MFYKKNKQTRERTEKGRLKKEKKQTNTKCVLQIQTKSSVIYYMPCGVIQERHNTNKKTQQICIFNYENNCIYLCQNCYLCQELGNYVPNYIKTPPWYQCSTVLHKGVVYHQIIIYCLQSCRLYTYFHGYPLIQYPSFD